MMNREETPQEELGSVFAGLKKPENGKLLRALKLLMLVILFAFVLLVTTTAFFFFDYFRKLPNIVEVYNGNMINPVTRPYFILLMLGLLTLVTGTFFLIRKKSAWATYVLIVGDLICFILSVRI
jgi:hypothetical protein